MKIQASVVSFAAAIANAGSACKLSAALAFLLAACPPSALHAAVEVLVERNSGANWKFQTVPNPSRSDIAREGKLTIAGNQPEECCLSPDGLHNGVLPWQGKQTCDFFAFSNWNTNGGQFILDLGQVQPIGAVISYSWQEARPLGKAFLKGQRAPQVFTLFGSPDSRTWTKIADVDTRPQGWGGQHGKLPAEQSGLSLSRSGVRLIAFRHAAAGTLLRVWEQAGESGELTVMLPRQYRSATPVNLRGEKTGRPLQVVGNRLTFNLGAFSPVSFVLE